MSINETTRRAGPYATDGSQVEFPFAFKVFKAEDVVVTRSESGLDAELTLTTDYTVNLNPNQDAAPGGEVVLTSALNGPTITITSGMAATQPTVFTNAGGFFPRVLNDSLDRVTILIQQLMERLSRALLLPLGDAPVGQFPVVLPNGKFGWSTGTGADSGLRADLGTDAPGKGADIVSATGGLTVQAEINNLKQADSDLQDAQAELEEEASRFVPAGSLKNMAVNGTTLTDGTYPTPVSTELQTMLGKKSGGAVPADIGEVMFLPPSAASRLERTASYPTGTFEGGESTRFIPLDIRGRILGTSGAPCPFTPIVRNGDGILTFRYDGSEPLHTVLKGSLNYMVRNAATVTTALGVYTLNLASIDYPTVEGGNRGRRTLGMFSQFWADSKKFTNWQAQGDECFPLTGSIISTSITNGWSALYDSSTGSPLVDGYFTTSDTTEALRTDQPGTQTTPWISLASWDMEERCVYLAVTGSTTRKRLQCKTSGGTIFAVPSQSRDTAPGGGNAIYRVPSGVTHIRFHFKGPSDTATAVVCRVIPVGTSAEQDPTKGLWTPVSFDVCREVVFWPGATYALTLGVEGAASGLTIRDWGWRLGSGGLTCLYDAREVRSRLAQTFFTGR